MLVRIADIHEQAFNQRLERWLNMLAPLLTVVIGGLVGGLVLSVIGAILGINELALR
jgi:general secretion pathway protein F